MGAHDHQSVVACLHLLRPDPQFMSLLSLSLVSSRICNLCSSTGVVPPAAEAYSCFKTTMNNGCVCTSPLHCWQQAWVLAFCGQ
jgi:hypothetical protein